MNSLPVQRGPQMAHPQSCSDLNRNSHKLSEHTPEISYFLVLGTFWANRLRVLKMSGDAFSHCPIKGWPKTSGTQNCPDMVFPSLDIICEMIGLVVNGLFTDNRFGIPDMIPILTIQRVSLSQNENEFPSFSSKTPRIRTPHVTLICEVFSNFL